MKVLVRHINAYQKLRHQDANHRFWLPLTSNTLQQINPRGFYSTPVLDCTCVKLYGHVLRAGDPLQDVEHHIVVTGQPQITSASDKIEDVQARVKLLSRTRIV